MRIWLDGQCLQTASRLRGIGRYVYSFLSELVGQYPNLEVIVSLNSQMADEVIIAKHMLRKILPEQSIKVWQPAMNSPEVYSGYDDMFQISELALAMHVEMLNPDIILSTSPFEGALDLAVPYNPKYKQNNNVVQIYYDSIPERFPRHYLNNRGYKNMYFRRKSYYSKCDLILTISNFANKESLELLGNKSSVPIFAGVDETFYTYLDQQEELSGSDIDFLYVGACDFRKNVSSLIEAISIIQNKYNQKKFLTLVGPFEQAGIDELKHQWKSVGLERNYLSFHQNVSDHELVQFYRRAKVVVQPSFMEGFGLTALEAIVAKSCVAGSRDTALEEIIIDPRALFDPRDPQEIASILVELCNNENLRQQVYEVQKEAAKKFTWQNTAGLTYKYLLDLKKKNPVKPHDIDLIRQDTVSRLKSISSLKVNSDLARIFAANEPLKNGQAPKIVIDVTETTKNNIGTGIQRVVNNITQNVKTALDNTEYEHSLIYCDDWDGWYEFDGDIPETPYKTSKYSAGPDDIILLLDSSWNYHSQHKSALWDARLKGASVYTCLYDTVPLRHSAFCGEGMSKLFSTWFQTALTHSIGFICISKAVADELMAILEAIEYPHKMKIGYWQLGTDFRHKTLQLTNNKDKVKKNTHLSFLMVGTIEPRKAHEIALNAFEKIWQNGDDFKLIIIGRKGWGMSDFLRRIDTHPELGKRLFIKFDAEDNELADAYENCDALIACSYAEGFGLPIIEAGQMDIPIIASDIPVFREVSKSASSTYFFPVGSSNGLADVIRQFSEIRQTNSQTKQPHWPDWKESTFQLIKTITCEDWYIHYNPAPEKISANPNDIGNLVMRSELVGAKRSHKLEPIGNAVLIDNNTRLLIKLALTNQSPVLWSSYIDRDHNFPIKISIRSIADDGSKHKKQYPLFELPFPIIPHDTIYFPICFNKKDLPKNTSELEICLLQIGSGLWEQNLRVSVHKLFN